MEHILRRKIKKSLNLQAKTKGKKDWYEIEDSGMLRKRMIDQT